ncbi:ABC-2 transporter permease [Methanorbis rubei]|uniref:ABC-2 transporter permease n=1 Tax=Methanorbis rubei TaxID=3028300 RepID=A0AAE4MFC0_9EURY|nr:hypothetical protein [Methanocorpusculaceae archaeon Cs1]
MNGLILKDWLYLRKVFLILGGATVILAGFLVPMGLGCISYMIMAFFAVLMPVNAMSIDGVSRFDRYALALPRTRREIAAARYQFGLLCFGAAAAFCFAAAVLAQIFLPAGHADLLGISPLIWWAGIMGGTLLVLDVTLAVFYRYRVNISVVAIIAVAILPNLVVYMPDLMKQPMVGWIAVVLAVAGLAGLWVSWRVSLAAYERWDVN